MFDNIPYKATFTSDRFLLYEMKMTARMMLEGLTDKEIIDKVYDENIFQYPTEKSIKRMARTCVGRLRDLGDEALIAAIANDSQDVAKQICVYVMMKQYRIIGEFMITVIERFGTHVCQIKAKRFATHCVANSVDAYK